MSHDLNLKISLEYQFEDQTGGRGTEARALAGRPFANLGESAWWVGLEGKQMSEPRVYLSVGGVYS